jgi:DNA-binding response OmpR family regulator
MTSMLSEPPVVLIVDDHPDFCAMYAEALGFMGFHTVTASTGEDGFAHACNIHPDVVVADVTLPGVSGVELTRLLREDDRTKDAVIIVLTGRTFGRDEQQAIDAGCDRILLKPCLPDELALEIRQVLAARRSVTIENSAERAS